MDKFSPTTKPDSDSCIPEELQMRFQDRDAFIRIFRNIIQQSPPYPVLMFHGVGGIGKTYLMRFLEYEFYNCRNKHLPDQPHVFLSFKTGNTSTSVEKALWQAREQLLRFNKHFTFIRFDIVWWIWLEHVNNLKIDKNIDLLPEDINRISELLAIFTIVDVAKVINLIGQVFKRVKNKVEGHQTLTWFQEHIDVPKKISLRKALEMMDRQSLNRLLPLAFAADIAENMEHMKTYKYPLAIFIDTFETVQEQSGRSFGMETRSFIQALAEELIGLKANAVMIIAGQNNLTWAEVQRSDGTWALNPKSIFGNGLTHHDATTFESVFLRQYLVGNLSNQDARDYLLRCYQLSDPYTIEKIISFTSGYPLALGVVGDLVSETRGKVSFREDFESLQVRVIGKPPFGEEWQREVNDWLIERLFHQLDKNGRKNAIMMIKTASFVRLFNCDLLSEITDNLEIQDDFRQLQCYSFVEPCLVGNEQYYRLHPVIRDLLQRKYGISRLSENYKQKSLKWFESQESSGVEKSKWTFRVEILYLLWQLFRNDDAVQKLQEWFKELISTESIDICWELIESSHAIENTLPPDIQARLNLYRSILHSRTWHDKGANRELASLYAEKAILLASKGSNFDLLAEAYVTAAWAYVYRAVGISSDSKTFYVKALQLLNKASEIGPTNQNRSSIANALMLRAGMETANNPDFGNQLLIDQAIDLFKQAGDIQGQRESYFAKATIAVRLANWQQVIPNLEMAEALNQQLFPPDALWCAHIIQLYGEYYAQQKMWKQAEEKLVIAEKKYDSLHFIGGLCASIGWMGIVQLRQGKEPEGLDLLCEALRIEHDILGSQEGVAKWLYFLGEAFFYQQDFLRALQVLWLSEAIRAEISHTELRSTQAKINEIRKLIGQVQFEIIRQKFDPKKVEFAEYLF